MSDGFLGRWSRRKDAVRKGEKPPAEPVVEAKAAVPPAQPAAAAPLPSSLPADAGGGDVPVAEPPPTLEDAQSLTPESDFTRFARPDVAPEVRNTALKKLFADPHFNVMDGLDVYIDDYSKPDPMPPEMLRNLASAQFLKLFEEKPEAAEDGAAREVADNPTGENVAQSGSRTDPALPPAEDHADPDLRLQQDDAPGPAGPGEGPR